MANIENLKTDAIKESDGVWIDYGLGVRLKIARARNPKYKEFLRKLVEPLKVDMRAEKTSMEELNKALITVRANTILLGWENIEDSNGNQIPYSAKKAEEFFSDPELKDFYEFVVTVSESADKYKKILVEESEKN